jgi:hypothetical protein
VREEDYRIKGYAPEYNQLPRKSDYDAAEAERKAVERRTEAYRGSGAVSLTKVVYYMTYVSTAVAMAELLHKLLEIFL